MSTINILATAAWTALRTPVDARQLTDNAPADRVSLSGSERPEAAETYRHIGGNAAARQGSHVSLDRKTWSRLEGDGMTEDALHARDGPTLAEWLLHPPDRR